MEISIKDIRTLADVQEAVATLLYAVTRQPRVLLRDSFTLVRAADVEEDEQFPEEVRVEIAFAKDPLGIGADPDLGIDGYATIGWPRPLELGPVPCPEAYDRYVPCPDRGRHLRLTECWACWSDVHRGAVVETDVLAEEAWTAGLSDLVS